LAAAPGAIAEDGVGLDEEDAVLLAARLHAEGLREETLNDAMRLPFWKQEWGVLVTVESRRAIQPAPRFSRAPLTLPQGLHAGTGLRALALLATEITIGGDRAALTA